MKRFNYRILFSEPYRTPLIVILIGALIRFVLMPASAHLDLFLASRREYLWVFKNAFVMTDITETSLALYFKLIKPLLARLPEIFDLTNNQGTLNLPEFEKISVFSLTKRYVFLFKLPYLLFDLASLYFIWRLFDKTKERITALIFWAVNPVFLYAVYLIGRYEVFPVFFTLISLYFLKTRRNIWSVLLLGVAISTRMPFVLLLPFWLIYLAKDWKELIKYGAVALLPFLLFTKGIELIWGQSIFADLEQGNFVELMFMKPSIGDGINSISPFILFYPAVVYLFYREREKMIFAKLAYFCILGLLVFYTTGYLGPQYFAWLTPFLIIALVKNPKILWPMIGLFLAFFLLQDIFSNTITTTIGFYVLDFDFFYSWPGLRFQEPFYDYRYLTLVTILHSVYVLMAISLAYVIYKGRNNEIKS